MEQRAESPKWRKLVYLLSPSTLIQTPLMVEYKLCTEDENGMLTDRSQQNKYMF